MKSALRIFLVFFCFWWLSLAGVAQELPFIFYPRNLLASGQLLAFQQNDNKEILFATKEGVYSFDGKRTKRLFSFANAQISGIEQALFSSQELAIRSEGALFLLDLKSGEIVKIRGGGVENVFYYQAQDQLFLSTKSALELLKKNGETEKILDGLQDTRFIEFGAEEHMLLGGRSLSVYSKDWILQEKIKVEKTILDSYYHSDRLLILTAEAILSKERNAGLKKEQTIEANVQPSCLLEDQTGRIWVGTKKNGVLLYDGNRSKLLSHENDFFLNGVSGIYQSKDFSLWFYGPDGFVFKAFSSPFQKFQLGRHLAGVEVEDIKTTDQDEVAVLSREGHYHLIKNEKLERSYQIPLPFSPAFSRIIDAGKTIHFSQEGEAFLYHRQSGLSKSLKKEIRQVFTFPKQSLLVDQKGAVLALDHETLEIWGVNWAVSMDKPLSQKGRFLIYTDQDKNLKKWDSKKGQHELIGGFKEDMQVGALFEEKHFIFLSQDQHLKYAFEDRVEQLAFNLEKEEKVSHFFISNADLWISTADHLFQIGLTLKGDTLKVGEAKVFKAQDYNIQLPVVKSVEQEDGSFWLVSENNLFRYNPLALAPDITPPGLVLDQLMIQNKEVKSKIAVSRQDSINIKLHRKDHLLINAYAVNYDPKNQVSLKYRYSAKDQGWQESLGEEVILLSGFEPGRHVVELVSENEQGVRSKETILLYLDVDEPFWYKWWALLGASLSIVLIGFMAYNGIKSVKESKSREAKEMHEKELLKLQKRSHEQMMKADGLRQINELITAQKVELEDKNKQIISQKYELSLTNIQIKQQKDLIEKTSESLQSSINYAQRIQTALMADEIQLKQDLPESFVFFKPRDQVSGDFFWFEKALNQEGEEVLVIAAVDCTGHGVPGAIVSVVGIQLLNAIVKAKGITDPGDILNELNADLLNSLKYEQTKINDGMDISLCTINLEKKKLYFAGAKNPLYIVENGELEIIKGDKQPIGGQKLKEEKDFKTHEIALKGDGKQMFYLFTDGYQDQFGGPAQFKFLTKNFKSLLLAESGKPMMEQKYVLGKTLKEWQGEESQTDDILVLGFKI